MGSSQDKKTFIGIRLSETIDRRITEAIQCFEETQIRKCHLGIVKRIELAREQMSDNNVETGVCPSED